MLSGLQLERLAEASAAHGGVLSTSDLAVLLDRPNPPRLGEAARALIRDGILSRVRRGLYVDRLHGYRPEILGHRWVSPSYLSTESALDRYELCQTGMLAYTYVTTMLLAGRTRAVRALNGHRFVYRHVRPHLFFGFRPDEGLWVADPEKAVIDFLYFFKKGQRSAVSPEEIAAEKLDLHKFRRYLRRYRQRGFERYALGWLAERGVASARRQHSARH
jgi:predicted transcriptional regulator of viral defense system